MGDLAGCRKYFFIFYRGWGGVSIFQNSWNGILSIGAFHVCKFYFIRKEINVTSHVTNIS